MDSDDEEEFAEIIKNINDNLQDLILYTEKFKEENNKLREELLNIKQHINKFFNEI